MDQTRKQKLIDGGINVDSALARMMGSEKMLEKYLGRFPEDKSYAALVSAIAADDEKAAAAAVHTLKSVCGTLGCEKLQEMVVNQEKAIRGGDWAGAKAMMAAIAAEYERICQTLQS